MTEKSPRFQIKERLTEGHTVIVSRGLDTDTNREVVIKSLRDDLAALPAALVAFSTASKLGAQVLSPHLVPVIAARRMGTHIFSVSPWVNGTQLRDLPWPMPPGVVAALLSQLADAVNVAHAGQVLLRGFHPRDLRVRTDGTLLLLDLNKVQAPGLSGALPPAALRQSVLRYLPMEARGGGAVDARSDIFCLGALALELLTGVGPTQEGALDMTPALVRALTAGGPLGAMAKIAMTLASPRADQRPQNVNNLPGRLADIWRAEGATPRSVLAAWLAQLSAVPRPLQVPATPPPVLPPPPSATPEPTDQEVELLHFFDEHTSPQERDVELQTIQARPPNVPKAPVADPWGLRSAGRFRSLEKDISSEGDQSGFAYLNDSGRMVTGVPPDRPQPARPQTTPGGVPAQRVPPKPIKK